MKRIAVIGLGKMGLLHSSILNTMRDVEVACICEKSGLIRLYGRKVLSKIPVVKELNGLIDANIDAIYVTTPAFTHYPLIKEIYAKSISNNIFVEKPFTFNYDQSKELCDTAARHGGITMVGFMKRFAPTYKMAKSFVVEGRLGKIKSFAGHAYSSDFYALDEFVPQAYARGDVLRDIGCHAIDMMLWILGEMKVLKADLTIIAKSQASYVDSVHAQVGAINDSEGVFDASWSRANYRLPEIGISITGSEGTMIVNEEIFEFHSDGNKPIVKKRAELENGVPFFLAESDYYLEDRCFIDALGTRSSGHVDFSVAAKTDFCINSILETGGYD